MSNIIKNFFHSKDPVKRIHLDYASTTPVHQDVFSAMKPYFSDVWANASAIYAEGVAVREVIEDERAKLARLFCVRQSDVVYTSGGTESNNLAILGLVYNLHARDVAFSDMEIISTSIEHPSILQTLKHVEKLGVIVRFVSVDGEGRIDIKEFESLLTDKTRLVTFAYVNSEIGVIQDVKKISRIVRGRNEKYHTSIYVHIDACQAPLWLPCALDALGVDMMSLDAGKCYGPKGVGVLLKRHWVGLSSSMFGGGQEGGLRAGTENTALVVGCTRALVRAQDGYEAQSARVQTIRDYAFKQISEHIPRAVINGSIQHRVANNINISIVGIDGEYAVITLDAHGVAASTRSACGAGKGAGSLVVRAISDDDARALSTIRLTLGEESHTDDIDVVIDVLKKHLSRMQV